MPGQSLLWRSPGFSGFCGGCRGQILRPAGALHGDCFYLGLCKHLNDTESRIRETTDYIDDAERLAPAE